MVAKTTQSTVTGTDQCEKNIKFEDVSDKIEQCLPSANSYRSLLDPYPSQTPEKYLSKEYKIDSFTIDDTWVSGVSRNWFFPQALFAVPQIADIIKHYKYFRADVQVDIRIASSAFHQGLAQISWFPCQNGNPNPEVPGANPIYRWSAMTPVDVSYAAQQSATICMPYLNPSPYIDNAPVAPIPADLGLIGCVIYSQITPYRVISDVGPFQVSVWAKFVNPQVAAPIVAVSAKKAIPKMQSVRVKPETTTTRRYVDPEALTKTMSDTMVATASNGPLAPVINTVGKGLEFAESAASAVTSFFGLFDKPTSVKSGAPMMQQFGRDFTLTSGLDTSLRIGQHPTSKLATTGIFPMETSHITMSKLAQIPMLYHVDYFNSTRGTFQLFLEPISSSCSRYLNYTRDYFHYVAAAHQMWRGSQKFRIKFVCGQFIKARVQISVLFNFAPDTSGQVYTRVVEVNGETETTFTIPFLLNRYWAFFDDGIQFNDLPILQVSLIDTVVGGSTGDDPTVDIVMWRAAGEDIQFAGLRSAYVVPPTVSKIPEQQSSLREMFSKPFDTIVCDCTRAMEVGYCTDDLSTTVADAMKRYAYSPDTEPAPYRYTYDDAIVNGIISPTSPLNSVFNDPYWYFKSLFLFERGDIRLRLTNDAPGNDVFAQALILGRNNLALPGNGTVYTYTKHNPELQVEVPYSSCYPYLPNQGNVATQTSLFWDSIRNPRIVINFSYPPTGDAKAQTFIAASDNMVCGVLVPPPYVDGQLPVSKTRKKNT
jgi:hypothetical protein